jgi:hypothetical protein
MCYLAFPMQQEAVLPPQKPPPDLTAASHNPQLNVLHFSWVPTTTSITMQCLNIEVTVYGKFWYLLVPHKDVAAVRPTHDILVRGSIETDPLCVKEGSGVGVGVAWGGEKGR